MTNTLVLAEALRLAALNIPVFPCNPEDKTPLVGRDRDKDDKPIPGTGGLKKASADEKQVRAWWRKWPDAMIGVPCGEVSGIVVLDPDRPKRPGDTDGVETWEGWLAQHGDPKTRVHLTPHGGRHNLFAYDRELPLNNGDKHVRALGINVRGDGGYIVWPPSVMEDGKTYSVLADVPLDELSLVPGWLYSKIRPRRVSERAAAAVQKPNGAAPPYPRRERPATREQAVESFVSAAVASEVAMVRAATSGARHSSLNEAAFSLGTLVGANVLSEQHVFDALRAACDANGLIQEGRLAEVERTIRQAVADGSQSPRDLSNVGTKVRLPVATNETAGDRYLDEVPPLGVAVAGAAGSVVNLRDARARRQAETPGALPAKDLWNPWAEATYARFPMDTLPKTVRDWCEDRHHIIGADLNAWPLAMLTAIAGRMDHRITLKPKRFDDYRVRPRLRVMLVGNVSVRKSAPVSAVAGYLREIDSVEIKAYNAQKGLLEERLKRAKDDDLRDRLTREIVELPHPRRRMVEDATGEALCNILAHHDGGTTLVRDELPGIICSWEKYAGGKGSGQDRSIWLQAQDGGAYTQDRVKGTRVINNLSANIFGSAQPDRLKELGKLDSDGLLQRFIAVMMNPSDPEHDEARDPQIRERVDALLKGVDALHHETVFLLSDQARTIAQAFSEWARIASQTTIPSPAFGTFVGKLPVYFFSLCLILHAVEIVEGREARTSFVSGETAERANRIVRDFIVPHGFSFYEQATGGGAGRALRSIATVIARHDEPTIKLRVLRHRCRAIRDLEDNGEVIKALFPFVASGWLSPVEDSIRALEWHINPGVPAHFVEIANTFHAEQLAIAKLIPSRAPAKGQEEGS